MGKNYTSYVIVLIVLFSITIYLNFINLMISIFGKTFIANITQASGVPEQNMALSIIVGCITLAIAIIYLIQLIKVKKTLFLWTHIAFGYYVVSSIVSLVHTLTMMTLDSFSTAITIAAIVISVGATVAVWITFYKHLLKAKATKKLVFD